MPKEIRIAVVTDNAALVSDCVVQLEREGFVVLWERHSETAELAAAVASGKIDLLIADSSAPVLPPLVVLKLLEEWPSIPVVVVARDDDDAVAAELLRLGVRDVVALSRFRLLGPIVTRELDVVFRSRDWFRAVDELQAAAQAVVNERKKVEARLRFLGTHDILTGLHNRAYFEEELDRLQNGRKFPVSIVMVDVDGLKRVNDHLGHASGDLLLKRVGRVLRAAFRAEDVVARIGGDEFSALLPLTDSEAAAEAVRRIRQGVSADNVVTPFPCLSLSIGVETAEAGTRLVDTWNRADALMYQDKLRHHMLQEQ